MSPKIFLLGATGFIGGDALFALVDGHPSYDLTCLVRNSERGAQVASQYSKARLVYGTLEDFEILEREAAQADIILSEQRSLLDRSGVRGFGIWLHLRHLDFANAGQEGAARAIIKGLSSKETEKPGFYIHTSGISVLMVADIDRKTLGETASKIFNDWDGIEEVISLPDHAPYRNVERIVIDGEGSKVKTAVVCPPTIYGVGRGPGNQRSDQVPEMIRCTLERKQAFHVGAGENSGSNICIHDLSNLYVKLVEAAAEGGGSATWNKSGYYFAENGEHAWGQVSKAIAKATLEQGLLSSDEVATVHDHEADKMMNRGAVLWGGNARCRAIRGRKLLGWVPKIQSFDSYIPKTVTMEAKSLGLIQGHAAKVVG